jgi:hypothetical protein
MIEDYGGEDERGSSKLGRHQCREARLVKRQPPDEIP